MFVIERFGCPPWYERLLVTLALVSCLVLIAYVIKWTVLKIRDWRAGQTAQWRPTGFLLIGRVLFLASVAASILAAVVGSKDFYEGIRAPGAVNPDNAVETCIVCYQGALALMLESIAATALSGLLLLLSSLGAYRQAPVAPADPVEEQTKK